MVRLIPSKLLSVEITNFYLNFFKHLENFMWNFKSIKSTRNENMTKLKYILTMQMIICSQVQNISNETFLLLQKK